MPCLVQAEADKGEVTGLALTNLFIIGNGFDIAHNIKTEYNDFRKYLIDIGALEDIDYSDNIMRDIPEYSIAPDGDEVFDKTEIIKTFITCIDDLEHTLWKQVEKSLGMIEYSKFLDTHGIYEGERIQYEYNRNEDYATNLYKALRQLNNYFHDWLKTIKITAEPLYDFANMIDKENDLFLNFNYTKTLQQVYGVKNVCHIHGSIGDETIYFGHCNDEFDSEYYNINYIGSEYPLKHLHKELRKNTQEAFEKNIAFFNKIIRLANQSELNIYEFGFSYSKVDEFYLEKIFRSIDTSKMRFAMNDFDGDKIEDFKKIAIRCGYEGEFSTFHINPIKGRGLFKNLPLKNK